ncbi:MAG TPA: TIGR03118 family protein, partial [Terracidiphilus sp.]
PFNVQNIGGRLYVTYAMQDADKHDEVDGAGLGYVDVFSTDGHLLQRLQHTDFLNAPWGIALAPSDFGVFSHDLLVGQFGSGNILVFDPVTGGFRGRMIGTNSQPIAIDGLWGIGFGNDSSAGNATTLFFAAGPEHESHGLFGTLTAVENVLGGDQ